MFLHMFVNLDFFCFLFLIRSQDAGDPTGRAAKPSRESLWPQQKKPLGFFVAFLVDLSEKRIGNVCYTPRK